MRSETINHPIRSTRRRRRAPARDNIIVTLELAQVLKLALGQQFAHGPEVAIEPSVVIRCKDYVVLLCGSDKISDLLSSVRDRFLEDNVFAGLEGTLFSGMSVFTRSTLQHDRLHLCVVIMSTVFDGDYDLRPILMYVMLYLALNHVPDQFPGRR